MAAFSLLTLHCNGALWLLVVFFLQTRPVTNEKRLSFELCAEGSFENEVSHHGITTTCIRHFDPYVAFLLTTFPKILTLFIYEPQNQFSIQDPKILCAEIRYLIQNLKWEMSSLIYILSMWLDWLKTPQ